MFPPSNRLLPLPFGSYPRYQSSCTTTFSLPPCQTHSLLVPEPTSNGPSLHEVSYPSSPPCLPWLHTSCVSPHHTVMLSNRISSLQWDMGILVPLSPTTFNVIGCKWMFHIKHKPDGNINSYKARLFAKSFH